MDFADKKILFIAPKFYGYHQEIIDYMKANSANVTFFAEDIYTPLYRLLNKVIPRVSDYIKEKYRGKILRDAEKNNYDFVFVVRGGILTPSMMEKLKTKLSNAYYIMYQWDSNQQSEYENIIKYFDVVKTFDRLDAKKYNLDYLPLFYSKQYEEVKNTKEKKKYDIVFFGAYHSNRLEIVKFFDSFCSENNLKFKYHLYITKMGLFRLVCTGVIKLNDLKYLKIYTVSKKEILDTYRCSLSVLDIELNIQNGLTMRTFETLGGGLKLITTNQNILNEPFYNKNNIILIDSNKPQMDLSFFKNDFNDNNDIFSNFGFEKWINNLFGGFRR